MQKKEKFFRLHRGKFLCLSAQSLEEVGVLGKLALQFAFGAQFEVLEAEGGGYSATYQAETSFRWDVGSKPLARLNYHLHFVIGIKMVHGQTAVGVDNV